MPDARCANNFPVFQDQHNLSAGVAEPTEVSLQVLQELKPCHLAAPARLTLALIRNHPETTSADPKC